MSDGNERIATPADLAGLLSPDLGRVTEIHQEIVRALRSQCPDELRGVAWVVEPVFDGADTLIGISLSAPETKTSSIRPMPQGGKLPKLYYQPDGKITVPGNVLSDVMQRVFTDSPDTPEANWQTSEKYRGYLESHKRAKRFLSGISSLLKDQSG